MTGQPALAYLTALSLCRLRSILRFRDSALERRHSGAPGESAADAAEKVITAEGGTGEPAYGGEIAARLHAEHGLRACDMRHVTHDQLEAAGVAKEECSAALNALVTPPPAPEPAPAPVESAPATAPTPAAAGDEEDDGLLRPTMSKQAQTAFDRWLSAIHLDEYASAMHSQGMDDLTDLTEVLEDDRALEQFKLKLFEQARLLRAAATIDAGDERDDVERAASVGAVQRSASGGIGLGRSASAGGDAVSWLQRQKLGHLVEMLAGNGGLHLCDLNHVTDEQLQAAGVGNEEERQVFLQGVAKPVDTVMGMRTRELMVEPLLVEPVAAAAPAPEPQVSRSEPELQMEEAVPPPKATLSPLPPAAPAATPAATQCEPPLVAAAPSVATENGATVSAAALELPADVSGWLTGNGLGRYAAVFAAQEMSADSLRALAKAAGSFEEWMEVKQELQSEPFSMTLGAVLALRERLTASPIREGEARQHEGAGAAGAAGAPLGAAASSMTDAVLVGLASQKFMKATGNVVGSELWKKARQ